MIRKRKEGDLNIAYRPYRMDEVFGNNRIKNLISGYLNKKTLPHASRFIGPAGCGKTTFARIVALGLNCETGITDNPCCVCPTCRAIINLNSLSVIELDGARARDIATVRKILNDLPAAPFGNDRFRILIIDEAHKLTTDAEEALLKFLEDTPAHVYVILCTNEPKKLKETTLQRCKPVQFSRLDTTDIFALLEQVAQFEGMNYNKEILQSIVEESAGTPRIALSFLQQINAEGTWSSEAASYILTMGVDIDAQEVVNLGKCLLSANTWSSVRDAYLEVTRKIPPENTRIALTGFLTGCLKRAHENEDARRYAKAAFIMSELYYGPKPEHRILMSVFRCYEVLRGRLDI